MRARWGEAMLGHDPTCSTDLKGVGAVAVRDGHGRADQADRITDDASDELEDPTEHGADRREQADPELHDEDRAHDEDDDSARDCEQNPDDREESAGPY